MTQTCVWRLAPGRNGTWCCLSVTLLLSTGSPADRLLQRGIWQHICLHTRTNNVTSYLTGPQQWIKKSAFIRICPWYLAWLFLISWADSSWCGPSPKTWVKKPFHKWDSRLYFCFCIRTDFMIPNFWLYSACSTFAFTLVSVDAIKQPWLW